MGSQSSSGRGRLVWRNGESYEGLNEKLFFHARPVYRRVDQWSYKHTLHITGFQIIHSLSWIPLGICTIS